MKQKEIYVRAISEIDFNEYDWNIIKSFSGDEAIYQAKKFADEFIEGKRIRGHEIGEAYDISEDEVVIEVYNDEAGETYYCAGVMLKKDYNNKMSNNKNNKL